MARLAQQLRHAASAAVWLTAIAFLLAFGLLFGRYGSYVMPWTPWVRSVAPGLPGIVRVGAVVATGFVVIGMLLDSLRD